MPILYVLVGLPACGKSTFKQDLVASNFSRDWFYYSTDQFIEDRAQYLGKTYDECFESVIGEATKKMNMDVANAIKNKENVIWDQTNLTVKKRMGILSQFPSKEYEKKAVVFTPLVLTSEQDEEHKRRLASRPGKTIPPFIMKSMKETYVLPTLEEGFDSIESDINL